MVRWSRGLLALGLTGALAAGAVAQILPPPPMNMCLASAVKMSAAQAPGSPAWAWINRVTNFGAWTWSFNKPPNGVALPYDNFLSQNTAAPEIGQIRATRPGEGWFIPGFGLTLTAGETARRIKSDWNGDGAVNIGGEKPHGRVLEKDLMGVTAFYVLA